MKVMIKKVGREPEVVEIKDRLEVYQEIVGGHIEVFPLWDNILCICNEDGKLNGMLPNIICGNDVICGDIIFISARGEDFVGLSEIQIDMLNILLKSKNY